MTKENVIEILERFVFGAKPCSQREIVDACASACRMLKEQPSLPSNLDEAAFNIVNDAIDTNDTTIIKYEGLLKYLVKAGAEWMAGQGETIECSVDWYNGPILDFPEEQLLSAITKAELKIGDKVVVQIRKKQ